MTVPHVAVTMGDPAGVGPELCLRLLGHGPTLQVCQPVIVGDAAVLQRVATQCHLPFETAAVSQQAWKQKATRPSGPVVLDCEQLDAEMLQPGQVSAECGKAAFHYITTAIDLAMAGQVVAVVTAPIHKEAFQAAGIDYPGHTEIFAEKSGAAKSCMMLTSEKITVSLVTTHCGYDEVPGQLSAPRIVDVIELTHDAMRRLRRRRPRLVVCGLNPHGGEHGLFGHGEEEHLIAPAVAEAQQRGIDVAGPVSPDTAFVPGQLTQTDAYICMYHDQGLIPLKMLAFDSAVNVTLGLPIVRTSVDHGTAFDIAWTGQAKADSLYAAVALAVRLASPDDDV